ncbi:MAG: carboxypeptidase-like regulatory domain-containing protein [Armatimonadota bacterium]
MRPNRLCNVFAVILLLMCLRAYADVELSGTVVYPDGRPAAGAKVEYVMSNTCSDKYVTTDNSGVFTFQAKPGTYYLDATIGDYVGTCRTSVSDDGKVITKPEIKLQYACLILGEVTDANTYQPIEGAHVGVYMAYGAETKSESSGTFKLRVLPVAGLQLEVSKSGYVTTRTNFSAEGKDSMAFRVALKPGGVIRGRVTDEKGEPIQGVEVRAVQDQVYGVCAKTAADGLYELRDVDTSADSTVYVSADSYSSSIPKTAQFATGSKEITLDFSIKRTIFRNITGRVTDSNGSPIPGAAISFGTSTCAGNKKTTATDADGNYRIDNASPRADMILVQCKGYAPAFLSVEADKDQKLDAVLGKPHFAKGKIVDASGKPIPNVGISVNAKTPVLGRLYDTNHVIGADIYRWLESNIRTDAYGEFSLKDLPADGVVLGMWEENHTAPDSTPICVDSDDNVIVMHGKPMIAGKVVDAATGVPIHGFTAKWETSYLDNSVFDTPDGTFKVQIDENRFYETGYNVVVSAKGYLAEEKTIKTTEWPNVDYSNVFKLQKASPIIGKVVDSAGKDIAGANVTIAQNDSLETYSTSITQGSPRLTAVTDADGKFRMDSALSHVAVVIVEKDGFAKSVLKNVDVTKPVNVTLTKAATLEVRADGLGGESNYIYLSAMDDTFQTADQSENGKAIYKNLMPVRYRLQVTIGRHSTFMPVSLADGQNMVLDIDNIPRPVKLHGTATRRGIPVPNVAVETSQGDDRVSCGTNDLGEYDLALQKTGAVAVNWYESQIDGCSRSDYSKIDLKPGENRFDIALPGGIVSGSVIDAGTGQPLIGKKVQARRWANRISGKSYDYPWTSSNTYVNCQSYGETRDGGTFTLDGISEGEVFVTVGGPYGSMEYVSAPLKITKDGSIDNLALSVGKPGFIDLKILDQLSGKFLDRWVSTVMTSESFAVAYPAKSGVPAQLPAGKYKLWIEPSDGRHIQVCSDLEIKPGKTAKVQIKVPKARQRIVFKVPKNSKFAKLDWTQKQRDWRRPGEEQKSGAWIGYSISDAATGKSVLAGHYGPEWGGKIAPKPGDDLAIPIKPGTYLLEAVLRDTFNYSVKNKANLWQVKTKLTVKAGKDTVVLVK